MKTLFERMSDIAHANAADAHICHWPGCVVKGRAWCLDHWGRLPASMRERLRHLFAGDKDFVVAMREAQAWAEKDERRVQMINRGWTYDL